MVRAQKLNSKTQILMIIIYPIQIVTFHSPGLVSVQLLVYVPISLLTMVAGQFHFSNLNMTVGGAFDLTFSFTLSIVKSKSLQFQTIQWITE